MMRMQKSRRFGVLRQLRGGAREAQKLKSCLLPVPNLTLRSRFQIHTTFCRDGSHLQPRRRFPEAFPAGARKANIILGWRFMTYDTNAASSPPASQTFQWPLPMKFHADVANVNATLASGGRASFPGYTHAIRELSAALTSPLCPKTPLTKPTARADVIVAGGTCHGRAVATLGA